MSGSVGMHKQREEEEEMWAADLGLEVGGGGDCSEGAFAADALAANSTVLHRRAVLRATHAQAHLSHLISKC